MIGAIVGDIAGSLYEFRNVKTKDFPLFAPRHGREARPTDDSMMTLAVARALLDAADDPAALPAAAVRRMREFAAAARTSAMDRRSSAVLRPQTHTPTTAGATAPRCA